MSTTSNVYCRLCARLVPINSSFDLTENMNIRNDMIDKLSIFSVKPVDFTDKSLPETVCTLCRDFTISYYYFFIKIKEAQVTLKKVAVNVIREIIPLEQSSVIKIEYEGEGSNHEDASEEVTSETLPCEEGRTVKIEFDYDACGRQTPQSSNGDPIAEQVSKKADSKSEHNQYITKSKPFPTQTEQTQTTDNSHKPKKRSKATIDDLTCDICSKVYTVRATLRKHKLLHTERKREFVCDVCGKAFYEKGTLYSHNQTHNPKMHDCKICKKTFINLIRLRKHLTTHQTAKPFECNECHKMFRDKKQISNHMAVHSDVYPYFCQYCNKGFRTTTTLKTHENIHTGNRPYSCYVCGMNFTNWSNCNKHMVRKHRVSLAKTAKTERGMMPLNPETLKPKEVDMESVEWGEQMMICKPRRKGRKKAEAVSES